MFQLTVWSVAPLLPALVAAGVYVRLTKRAEVPGVNALLALLAAVLFWSGCHFVESLLTGLQAKLLVSRLGSVAIILVPVLWFLFALGYSGRRMKPSRNVLNALAVIPLITICLVMTDDWHHLVAADARLVESAGYLGLVTEPGPWLFVHAGYGISLVVVATTILSYVLWTSKRELKPVVGVVVGPLIGCAAAMVDVSGWQPLGPLRFTTLGFVAAALILDVTVLRYGVLDNIPVLRDRVLEQLTEGVMVVARTGRIIDVNRSVLEILGTSRGEAARAGLTDFLPDLDMGALAEGETESLEVRMGGRCYDVTGAELDPGEPGSDVVLTFRDVTVRRNALQALHAAQDELQRLAHTDSLTGLYNRRLFMSRLNEEVQRVRRHEGDLSVVIVDLDYFKEVNDNYGHAAGDRVLQAVAEAAAGVKRGSDVVARIGGEEFALLLPATDRAGALHLAQRLREAIEAIDTSEMLGARLQITASIGLATVTGAEEPDHVLKSADDALYRAKNSGRNRVCSG